MNFDAFNVYKGIGRKLKRQDGYKPSSGAENMMAKDKEYQRDVLKNDKEYKKAYDSAVRLAKETMDAEVTLHESVGLRESKAGALNQDVLERELSHDGKYAKDLLTLSSSMSKLKWDKTQIDTFVSKYMEIIKDCTDKKSLQRSALFASLLQEQVPDYT